MLALLTNVQLYCISLQLYSWGDNSFQALGYSTDNNVSPMPKRILLSQGETPLRLRIRLYLNNRSRFARNAVETPAKFQSETGTYETKPAVSGFVKSYDEVHYLLFKNTPACCTQMTWILLVSVTMPITHTFNFSIRFNFL